MNQFQFSRFSRFSRFFQILTLTASIIIYSGCSSGNMELRRMESDNYANDINPFDYGDEFLYPVPDDMNSASDNNLIDISSTQSNRGLTNSNDETLLGPEDINEVNNSNSEVISFGYRVQIGAFNSKANADKLAESAYSRTDFPVYVEYLTPFYRVRVGDFARKNNAEKCVSLLKEKGFRDSRWVYTNINSK